MIAKVLIVEDEPLFRKGLSKIIQGSANGWEIIGEASNGCEAIEIMQQQQPDLIITDIRMPQMDGIQLTQYVYENKLDIIVIVVTGYQDFSYAQAVLRYGAFDLLTKPCDKQEVIKILEKALKFFREKQMLKVKQVNELLQKGEVVIRSLYQNINFDSRDMERVKSLYEGKELWFFYVTKYISKEKNFKESDIQLLQFSVFNIIEELMENGGVDGRIMLVEYDIYALFLTPSNAIAEFIEQAKINIENILGITLDISNQGVVDHLGQLTKTFEKKLRKREKDDTIDEIELENRKIDRFKIKSIRMKLMSQISVGQRDALQMDIQEIISDLSKRKLKDAITESIALMIALHETMRDELKLVEKDTIVRVDKLISFDHMDQIIQWDNAQLDSFMQRLDQWIDKNNNSIIAKAFKYIDENYMKKCNLSEIALYLHINSTYFSHLFKKETGENYVDYLRRLRIEKSKIFLANTDMSITEISGMVGYDLPNYFAKTFKGITRLSPGDYRRIHRGKS